MITLYALPISPFVDKIERVLRYKQLPYRTENLRISRLSRRRKLHGAAKVPVIEDEGRLIGDSTQIALYLEKTYPDRPLLPASPRERGLCLALEDWADESLYFHEMRLRLYEPGNAERFNSRALANEGPVMRALGPRLMRAAVGMTLHVQGMARRDLATFMADVRRHIGAVDGMLDGAEWLVGDRITLADVAVRSQLGCIAETPEGAAAVAEHPSVGEWMARVDAKTSR